MHIPQEEHSIPHRHPHCYSTDVVLDPGPSQPSFSDAAIINGSTACVDKSGLDSTIHFGCPSVGPDASQTHTRMDSRHQLSVMPTFGPGSSERQSLPQSPEQVAQVYDSCWKHTSQRDTMFNGATDMMDARNRKRNRIGQGSVKGDVYNQ